MPNNFVYWAFSYFGLHWAPTLMIYFGLFPTYFSLFDNNESFNEYTFNFGVIFSLGALLIETIADL